MKKTLRILLILMILTVSATCMAVTGFYINDNTSAVVHWFEGKHVVTNEEYKDYVDRTQQTAGELTYEIEVLTEKNNQLYINLELVTTQRDEAQLDSANKQELIDSLNSQIEDLNTQIAENNATIEYLNEYLHELYGKMLSSIIDVPDELKSDTLYFTEVTGTNDFYVNNSKKASSLYYFSYEEGYLVEARTTKQTSMPTIRRINGLDFVFGLGFDFATYNPKTNVYTILRNNGYGNILPYEDKVFFMNGQYTGYYSFETNTYTDIHNVSGLGNNFCTIYDFDECAFYSGSAHYFYLDKVNLSVQYFGDFGSTAKPRLFEFKNNYYFLGNTYIDGVSTYGLYRFDLTNTSMVLIQEFTYDCCGLNILENEVMFYDDTGYFRFDGETCSHIYVTDGNVISYGGDLNVMYEDEDHIVFSRRYIGEAVFLYTRSTGECSKLVESDGDWAYRYDISDTLKLFSSKVDVSSTAVDLFILDTTDYTVKYTLVDKTYYHFSSFTHFEDKLYVSYLSFNGPVYEIDLSTYTKSTVTTKVYSVGIYAYNEDTIVLYSSSKLISCDRATNTWTSYTIDLTKSNIETGEFYYLASSSFESMELYYLYKVNEDLSIDRNLAIFE